MGLLGRERLKFRRAQSAVFESEGFYRQSYVEGHHEIWVNNSRDRCRKEDSRLNMEVIVYISECLHRDAAPKASPQRAAIYITLIIEAQVGSHGG